MKNPDALLFSDRVNKTSFQAREVGVELSTDHPTLQQTFFKCTLSFIACLANNYREGRYDGRNEFACKCADTMMRGLEGSELYYKEFEDSLYKEILNNLYK